MAIKEMLLALRSFPAPTESRTIENVVALAENLKAMVSAIACELDIQSFIALFGDRFDATGLPEADSRKSGANARDLLAIFATIATQQGIAHDEIFAHCRPRDVWEHVVSEARFRDIAIMPLKERDEADQNVAEHLIFESGRPVLVLPDDERELPLSLENIGVAWDFSPQATRAVADALPFLKLGKQVRIFTIVDDKEFRNFDSAAALCKYLAGHGVEATLDEVRAGGRLIGNLFKEYINEYKLDLLVMGAYGHSRAREFVLGGATKSILEEPPTWVLMSH